MTPLRVFGDTSPISFIVLYRAKVAHTTECAALELSKIVLEMCC